MAMSYMISVDKKFINKEDRNGLCNTRVHSKVFFKHES
ncbi:unnamed protein product [Larinioides sclopetarius]|uniref:Uncharacterized protein n=1 Tax=Larinioides sclopetarius TaxID=280406 RepID=A0AAV1ZEL5_9ARAC